MATQIRNLGDQLGNIFVEALKQADVAARINAITNAFDSEQAMLIVDQALEVVADVEEARIKKSCAKAQTRVRLTDHRFKNRE